MLRGPSIFLWWLRMSPFACGLLSLHVKSNLERNQKNPCTLSLYIYREKIIETSQKVYIYIYIYILELPWQENLANAYIRHSVHWIAVSTLLCLISSADCDLHHWRSKQQPQYAEAETLPLGHRFMRHISTKHSLRVTFFFLFFGIFGI